MTLKEELLAAKKSAVIFDDADSAHLLIEGIDAASFLQRMVTNDVASLAIGKGQQNALLDRKGMVLSLFYLLRTKENSFHAILPALLLKKTEEILKKMVFLSKVTLTDVTKNWGGLKVIGSLPPSLQKRGMGGDFILVPKTEIAALKKQLALPEISKTAFDLLRMEAGIPEYGVDIDETHILLEANLPQTFKRNKGCYPGQEVVERIMAYGQGRTPKRLCALSIEGEHLVTKGTEILEPSGTHKVGVITSALYNPLEQKTIVLAYLDFKYSGTRKGLIKSGNQLFLQKFSCSL